MERVPSACVCEARRGAAAPARGMALTQGADATPAAAAAPLPPRCEAPSPPPVLLTPPGSPLAGTRRHTPAPARHAAAAAAAASAPPFAAPLVGLSIGMWTSHGARHRLLLLRAAFVLLVDRTAEEDAAAPGRATQLWSAAVGRLPTSPFTLPRPAARADAAAAGATPAPALASPLQAPPPLPPPPVLLPAAAVLAFELPHCHVTGMSYNNPLLLPGRLVLECAALTRRVFDSRAAALDFYGAGAAHAAAPPSPRFASPPPARTPPRRAASVPAPAAHAGVLASATPCAPDVPPAQPPPPRALRGKTVVLRFEDPHLPAALKRAMLADSVRCATRLASHLHAPSHHFCRPLSLQRLLRLVESGLPEWAVFLPSYGLPYRRGARRAAKALWICLALASLLTGFFDLYRHLPGAKHALAAMYRLSGVPEARRERLPRNVTSALACRADTLMR